MFKRRFNIFLFFVITGFSWLGNSAQTQQKSKQIEIKHAESLSYDSEKNNARVLSGNVICEHEGALLYCDTAYIYSETNQMLARGHILITKGDSKIN